MAVTKDIVADRSKQVRRDAGKTSGGAGCGNDTHMLVGQAGTLEYRSLVHFPDNLWADIKQILKIELMVRIEDNSTHFSYSTRAKVRLGRAKAAWSAGSNGENVWTAGEYQWPAPAGLVEKDLPYNPVTLKIDDEAWVSIDVTTLYREYVPTGILMPDGSLGLMTSNSQNLGIVFLGPGSPLDTRNRSIFYSFKASTTVRPRLRVTYDTVNHQPDAPTLLNPATTNVTFNDQFEGQHSDPDLDPMSARYIEVREKVSGKFVWNLAANLQSAGPDEVVSGRFSVPLSLTVGGGLKVGMTYQWRAATKDSKGAPTKWRATDGTNPSGADVATFSAWRDLLITSSAPSVVPTNVGSVSALASTNFGGAYSDPEGNLLALFQIQMRPNEPTHADAAWADPAPNVWDTGTTIPTSDEVASRLIARPYGGKSLGVGAYTYRIRVQDSTGVWSAWAYDDWALAVAFDTDPGNVTLTTQLARTAPVRVALYGMGTGRGPGKLIGYLDDPIDLGASAYLNGAGEMFFTLPALHPYCPSIEPHHVHYAVQQYYGDRYRTLFAGLVTDFDATADEMVVYGTDYLGLLQTAVDDRYDPGNADKAPPAGSKYTEQTIDAVVRDQLTYHKGIANSPVGFITVGPITALVEKVTIYSTYSQCLPFVVGLIDSHKQGTGREARLYARPTNPQYTAWEWALVDNWGRDRKNIRLEYGGLITDFRVVALGDFATRVMGVGQKRGEVKVYRATGTGGLDEAQWGRRVQTRFYQDIIDQNDLQRRVNEEASQLAKIGKRMALALQADVLQPFDGWDIGDSIVVDIKRGVVDTSLYGSLGLWTIYGLEWHYSPDGHTDLTLTVLPKKVAGTAPSDLIPSINPGASRDWQVGYGKATTYGLPPSPSTP
jgi:hypothetical protein